MEFSAKKKQQGFTLIEMVIGLFIFVIMIYGIVSLVSNIFTTATRQSVLVSDEDQARKVVFQIVNELRNTQTANDGSYSIGQAGDQQLVFFSNPGGSGNIVPRIRYYLQSKVLYKGVVIPTGNPLSYNLSAETVTAVQNDVANGSAPVFYYYDGNYDGSPTYASLAQPINLNSVKYIKINLIISNKAGISSTSTYTISDGAAIRNLKNNLGN